MLTTLRSVGHGAAVRLVAATERREAVPSKAKARAAEIALVAEELTEIKRAREKLKLPSLDGFAAAELAALACLKLRLVRRAAARKKERRDGVIRTEVEACRAERAESNFVRAALERVVVVRLQRAVGAERGARATDSGLADTVDVVAGGNEPPEALATAEPIRVAGREIEADAREGEGAVKLPGVRKELGGLFDRGEALVSAAAADLNALVRDAGGERARAVVDAECVERSAVVVEALATRGLRIDAE